MSLTYSENSTTYGALSTRWGNTPTTAEVCSAVRENSIDETEDINHIADRWGNGVPYLRVQKLDGIAHIYECRYVDLIDAFMMSECSADMLRSDISHFNDFIKYQDSELVRADLSELDDLLVSMVISGSDCQILQGANCGTH